MTQKLKRICTQLLLAVVFLAPLAAVNVAQAASVKCPDGSTAAKQSDCKVICPDGTTASTATDCKVTCLQDGKTRVDCADLKPSSDGDCDTLNECDLFSKYINPSINFLSAFVGVAVVISLIIGGIQYGSSAGDPQKVTAAKNRIRNAIIALVLFIFLYMLLNFLVPGGLLA